ncbi:MAG: FlgO family outer membrane protein, partial [Arenicellales bacterium]|nr:FlgO family outer membrane protein [Arenicellales bacterium]
VQVLGEVHDAQAVIVGTYAAGKNSVFVTAKLIAAKGNTVMASFDYQLPVGSNTRDLLQAD